MNPDVCENLTRILPNENLLMALIIFYLSNYQLNVFSNKMEFYLHDAINNPKSSKGFRADLLVDCWADTVAMLKTHIQEFLCEVLSFFLGKVPLENVPCMLCNAE